MRMRGCWLVFHTIGRGRCRPRRDARAPAHVDLPKTCSKRKKSRDIFSDAQINNATKPTIAPLTRGHAQQHHVTMRVTHTRHTSRVALCFLACLALGFCVEVTHAGDDEIIVHDVSSLRESLSQRHVKRRPSPLTPLSACKGACTYTPPNHALFDKATSTAKAPPLSRCEEKWYTQPLDHFSFATAETYYPNQTVN